MDLQDIKDKYKKLDHAEHVLSRPGMYIGSIEEDVYNTWIFDEKENSMVKKEIKVVPGLYKIYDEILVNAIDHSIRLKTQKEKDPSVILVKNIRIEINRDEGIIKITNDGDGIAVQRHPDHGIYIPELIFGNMLTSTNYNDTDDRIIGGQNGIGAKACNIFSKQFILETVDHRSKTLYKQEFLHNMTIKNEPMIKSCGKKPYTSITFLPDYAQFNLTGLSEDMYSLFVKRAYDVCALTDVNVNVFFNNKKLEYKNFEKYVDLYLGVKADRFRVYEKVNERLEVIVTNSTNMGFDQVSFVNGIWTMRGGKHTEYIANTISQLLCECVAKKRKQTDMKPQHIKNFMMIFVRATIPNPTFDSQSKDLLTTPVTKFGFKIEFTSKLIEKLYKSEIINNALALSEVNAQKTLKKTDGKKSTRIKGLVKLDDANFAGSAKSKDCTLILTEGDSAKSMAVCGLSEVGRDFYGVFPLRGKLLNVKDVTIKKLLENEEIQNIKKIMGLESGKEYSSVDELRYGKILIMSDQDHDGAHIRGLIINLFQTLWPSLFKYPNFITSLLTPILKVTHRSTKQQISFYNQIDFMQWYQATTNPSCWDVKYYKGLGTSTEKEAKEYFKQMNKVSYEYTDTCDNKLELAFNKRKASDRKTWLENYNSSSSLQYQSGSITITYNDFIDKELIHFSVYDVKRSIPSVVDGLKPSQRKILYSCFKRNLIKEIKVSQLAGYVSENAAYHHGEASLHGAIICMAQDFVGSNNINLLRPNGQFGSRVMGGKDASQPRYIYTELQPIVFDIFRKDDNDTLTYLQDDGEQVEPEYYVPVIPMALVNSCLGIGTGFSTFIPSYNPKDIIHALNRLIISKGDTTSLPALTPWYRGFKGRIELIDGKTTYASYGCYTFPFPNVAEITELPIGIWTEDYKTFLEDYIEKNPKVLKDYKSYYTTQHVRFHLHFHVGELDKVKDNFEKEFKLVNKNLTTSNMHLFDPKGCIKKYDSVAEILVEYYYIRLRFYELRKNIKIKHLENHMDKVASRVRFISKVCSGEISVMNSKKIELEKQLEALDFLKQDESYNYLLNIPVFHLTLEKQEQLCQELDMLERELDTYKSTSIEELWLNELEILETKYDDMIAEYEQKMTEVSKAPKAPKAPKNIKQLKGSL